MKKLGTELSDKRYAFQPDWVYLFDFLPNTGAYRLHPKIPKPGGPMGVDRLGNVWLCRSNALFRYSRFGGVQNLVPDSLKHTTIFSGMITATDGKIWIVGFKRDKIALCCWDNGAEFFSTYLIAAPEAIDNPSGFFGSGFRNFHGIFWFTSTRGLYRIDPATHSARSYLNDPKNKRSLNQNSIKSMLPDRISPDRFLWIGTDGGGLNRFEIASETFTHYTEKNGLPNDVVYGILADGKGDLRMSTNRGLSNAILNPETRDILHLKNYSAEAGLQGDEFNSSAYYQTQYGDMVFGGINGITIFHPDSIKDNPYPPPVVVTELRIHHQPVTIGEQLPQAISETREIVLPYTDNALAFEFVALDFSIPGKNLYSFMLENLDSDWSAPSLERKAAYTNLDPGKYVFHVRASNNDDVWNKAGAAIKITITPPWWRTWWAYILFGFLAFAVTFGIYRYELKRHKLKLELKQEHILAEKEHQHAEKLQELDRMKSRFFANISHEFRTPLTPILDSIEQLLNSSLPTEVYTILHRVHFNAARLLKLVNQLLDLSKLESGKMQLRARHGNLVVMARRIIEAFHSLAQRKGIHLEFHSESDSIDCYFDEEKLEKILYNLVDNAIKFTETGGRVDITVTSLAPESSSGKRYAEIKVSDTGIGIPVEITAHIFDRFYPVDSSSTREHQGTGIGLALVKELVEQHHGIISVASEQGTGTTFTVQLPLGKDHLKPPEIVDPPLQQEESITFEIPVGRFWLVPVGNLGIK